MNVRQNEGYVITDSFHIGEEEIVLGISTTAASQFATWMCRNQKDYFWGHYFTDQIEAHKDFSARIQEEIAYMEGQRRAPVTKDMEPSISPWGMIRSCETICPGVYSVVTSSGGGIMALREQGYQIFSKAAMDVSFLEEAYICFQEFRDEPVAMRELMDKGLYEAPVNDFFGPGEFENVVNQSLRNYHPEYWQTREKALAEQKERQNPQIKKKMKEHER